MSSILYLIFIFFKKTTYYIPKILKRYSTSKYIGYSIT